MANESHLDQCPEGNLLLTAASSGVFVSGYRSVFGVMKQNGSLKCIHIIPIYLTCTEAIRLWDEHSDVSLTS